VFFIITIYKEKLVKRTLDYIGYMAMSVNLV